MHVVRHDGEFVDVPSVRFATLVEQMRQVSDELTLQYSAPVLRHKHDVIHEPMERMATFPEYWLRHNFIVSQWAEGFGLSPALKRGACAAGCQIQPSWTTKGYHK